MSLVLATGYCCFAPYDAVLGDGLTASILEDIGILIKLLDRTPLEQVGVPERALVHNVLYYLDRWGLNFRHALPQT